MNRACAHDTAFANPVDFFWNGESSECFDGGRGYTCKKCGEKYMVDLDEWCADFHGKI